MIRPALPGNAPALARLRLAFRGEAAEIVETAPEFLERCGRRMTERLAGPRWRAWIAGIACLCEQPVRGSAVARQGLGSELAACLAGCGRCEVDAILWPSPRSRSPYRQHGFDIREDLLERRTATVRGPA